METCCDARRLIRDCSFPCGWSLTRVGRPSKKDTPFWRNQGRSHWHFLLTDRGQHRWQLRRREKWANGHEVTFPDLSGSRFRSPWRALIVARSVVVAVKAEEGSLAKEVETKWREPTASEGMMPFEGLSPRILCLQMGVDQKVFYMGLLLWYPLRR